MHNFSCNNGSRYQNDINILQFSTFEKFILRLFIVTQPSVDLIPKTLTTTTTRKPITTTSVSVFDIAWGRSTSTTERTIKTKTKGT